MRWRSLVPTRDDQSGSITPFVLIVTIALFMLAGLVIDGGRQMNSRSRAVAYAQEASRAGATAIDLSSDIAVVDKNDAQAAAARFCESAMARDGDLVDCQVTLVPSGNESGTEVYDVEVNTTVETQGILSGMFGVDVWTADGVARARPIQGVTQAQSGQELTMGPPETEPGTSNPFPTGGTDEPTGDYTECKKPYFDPYDPNHIWHKGDKPLDPPITEPMPTEEAFCWPPWVAPKPKKKDPKNPDNNGNQGDNGHHNGNGGQNR
ncbi:pilus assembly protein TadG-related protein [Nocardioidaceae bacterium SCSIO 66511]|nr:pilus assembly protein TadG-related protein [Nocardioidaceae bacterium SCSIO 66511]